jgi:transporter family-2 protein
MLKDPSLVAYLALAAAVGALGGIHVPMNGALGERIQSPLVATLVFYAVGFTCIATLALMGADRRAIVALTEVPRWYLAAGVISVVVVGASTFLIPRIGAVTLFVVFVSAQLLVRMVLSHFGWLGSPTSPVSWVKLLGGALLVLGAVLVVRD